MALREMEERIQREKFLGITTFDNNSSTVAELVERYISQKKGMRENTRANYRFVLNILKKESFGHLPISKVQLSDAKLWLIKLQEDGRGYSTIHAVRGVVNLPFSLHPDTGSFSGFHIPHPLQSS